MRPNGLRLGAFFAAMFASDRAPLPPAASKQLPLLPPNQRKRASSRFGANGAKKRVVVVAVGLLSIAATDDTAYCCCPPPALARAADKDASAWKNCLRQAEASGKRSNAADENDDKLDSGTNARMQPAPSVSPLAVGLLARTSGLACHARYIRELPD